MRQQVPFIDERLFNYCCACGDTITPQTRTIEHVPARAFLDRPFPRNLATVHSCFACNNGTSADERFIVCLLEAVYVGSADPAMFERVRVRQSVEETDAIARQLDSILSSGQAWDDGNNGHRLQAVILKLARGHAMYDLADPRYDSPHSVKWFRLDRASHDEAIEFERWRPANDEALLLPEVGSRALLRQFDSREEDKVSFTVQQDRYRYSYRVDSTLRIRLVLRDFLACEVCWSD